MNFLDCLFFFFLNIAYHYPGWNAQAFMVVKLVIWTSVEGKFKKSLVFESFTNISLFSQTNKRMWGEKVFLSINYHKFTEPYIHLRRPFMYLSLPKVTKFLFLLLLYGFNKERRTEISFRKINSVISRKWWRCLLTACNLGLGTAYI